MQRATAYAVSRAVPNGRDLAGFLPYLLALTHSVAPKCKREIIMVL